MGTTKKLFILVMDCGDGSYIPCFTFNEEWIKERDDSEAMIGSDYIGYDGDGFHYTVLNVPVECTLESLDVDDCVDY